MPQSAVGTDGGSAAAIFERHSPYSTAKRMRSANGAIGEKSIPLSSPPSNSTTIPGVDRSAATVEAGFVAFESFTKCTPAASCTASSR